MEKKINLLYGLERLTTIMLIVEALFMVLSLLCLVYDSITFEQFVTGAYVCVGIAVIGMVLALVESSLRRDVNDYYDWLSLDVPSFMK